MTKQVGEVVNELKDLAQIGVRSLLEARVTGTRTQLDVAEDLDKCCVVDGTCEVHTQLINGCLHTQRHTYSKSVSQ